MATDQYTAVPDLPQGETTQGQTTAAKDTQATTTAATADQAQVAQRKVGRRQTVQGQLESIIDKDSPLQQQAATAAKQQMASRGLINSSMAVGAGQQAVINSAMPIAQQDAATYGQAAQANTDAKNNINMFNTGQKNQVGIINAQEANATSRFNANNATQTSQFNASQSNQMSQVNAAAKNDMTKFNISEKAAVIRQGMDADTRRDLANIEANYQTLMQASQSAGQLYSQMLTNISNIQNNKDLSAEAKNAAVQQQYAYLKNGMSLIGAMNNLDMGDLLNFQGPGTPETGGGQGGNQGGNGRPNTDPPEGGRPGRDYQGGWD